MFSPIPGVFEIVPRSYGEMIGGGVAIGSGVLEGLLALGFPRPVGDPLLEGAYAAVVSPLGVVLLIHGWRLRKRGSLAPIR